MGSRYWLPDLLVLHYFTPNFVPHNSVYSIIISVDLSLLFFKQAASPIETRFEPNNGWPDFRGLLGSSFHFNVSSIATEVVKKFIAPSGTCFGKKLRVNNPASSPLGNCNYFSSGWFLNSCHIGYWRSHSDCWHFNRTHTAAGCHNCCRCRCITNRSRNSGSASSCHRSHSSRTDCRSERSSAHFGDSCRRGCWPRLSD